MPIYEYLCQSCGHHLEALQKMSEDPLVYCPECGEESLKKKVSAAAFRLKGSGWYETDFKDSGKEKPKSAEGGTGKESTADSKAGDSKSGDTKSGDSKSGDAKSGEAKSSDSKAAGSKSSESKSKGSSGSAGTGSSGSKNATPST
ncbi:MAG: zinc ribbon domain-containing protein [Pseudomonadota bacterium]|jgi:putative FmdB family regulatory protein|nr:zinc ribbon domain-containing protein [Pseudomonadota bacterium]MEE3288546.1 zinc ribbon domain-containing protein [Pseudomonadota bacterium]